MLKQKVLNVWSTKLRVHNYNKYLKCQIVQNFYIFNLILVIRLDVVALLLYLCSSNVAKPEEEEDTGGDNRVLQLQLHMFDIHSHHSCCLHELL